VPIFGKSEPAAPPAPERPAPSHAAPAAQPATSIGPRTRFVGEISGEEDVIVHGRFEGNIRVARTVSVAASGEVKGDVAGRSVIVGGRVHGQIHAEERAELLASASVQGNVSAPKVVIAEGAQLQGNVAMESGNSGGAPMEHQTKAKES
jgi:cytoskeletal protein CcmA (bactofilin family)